VVLAALLPRHRMENVEMFTEDGLEIHSLNYEGEVSNFESIIQQNMRYHQQVSQKLIKSAMKGRQNPMNFEKMDQAIHTLNDAANKIDSARLEVIQKKDKVEIVKKECSEMQKKVNLTAKSAQEYCDEADKNQLELKSLEAATSEKANIVEKKREKLSAELAKYDRILGLELVNSSHGGIIFVFSNIHCDNPDKKFSCEVGYEGKQYKVSSCLPMVPGIEDMVQLLNRTNDLPGFVVNLRKKFLSVI